MGSSARSTTASWRLTVSAVAVLACGPARGAPGVDDLLLSTTRSPYATFESTRYMRYSPGFAARRAMYDRLGQFVNYGTFGLQWNEIRDEYTAEKTAAGIPANRLPATSSVLREDVFFRTLSTLAIVREDYGDRHMGMSLGRNLSSTFTPLVFQQMHYGGLRVDYGSPAHDLTWVMSRGGYVETWRYSGMFGNTTGQMELSPVLVMGANWRRRLGALELGATDFIVKPSAGFASSLSELSETLIKKIKTAYRVRPERRLAGRTDEPTGVSRHGSSARAAGRIDRVIGVAASTGGPPDLEAVFAGLSADLPAAYIIVKHLPNGFAGSLARRLGRVTDIEVVLANEGDRIEAGVAYIAQHGRHVVLTGRETSRIGLDDAPSLHGVRPAADPTLASIAAKYAGRAVGVVLTGMGSDGAAGLAAIRDAGGETIVQNEETSVVWGMPGAAVKAGAASHVVALDQVEMLVQHRVEIGQRFPVRRVHGLVTHSQEARLHLGGKLAAHGQIIAHGALHPGFLVGPAAIHDLTGGAFAGFELPSPFLGWAVNRRCSTM